MIITGTVIPGEAEGTELGVPTANLRYELLEGVADGVWASWTTIRGQRYPSVTVIGVPFRSDQGKKKFETHVFDWKDDLYGESIAVELVEMVSEIEHFDRNSDLLDKIYRDFDKVKSILGA